MRSLGLLEVKLVFFLNIGLWAIIVIVVHSVLVMVVHGLVVEVFALIAGLLALVVDFREVMLTSALELAQCALPLLLNKMTNICRATIFCTNYLILKSFIIQNTVKICDVLSEC